MSRNIADQVPRVPAEGSPRLQSLDAFRGATMLLMASGGLGISQLASTRYPESPIWMWLATQTEHAAWEGCTVWDLIQPAFMFMVGVAVPFSLAKRRHAGAGFAELMSHALLRAVILVLLAVFLGSTWSNTTQWSFTNVLAQIGLGYPFLFALAYARPAWQFAGAMLILIGYWLWFVLFPLPGPSFPWELVGVPDNWPHLSGFAAHWEKNANAAAAFDGWFLNLFHRSEPFEYSSGGYQTLNFVPSIATMVFGLLAGELLQSNRSYRDKVLLLVGAGVAGIVVGWLLGMTGVCPIVKRIWTPSWTLFSAGWVSLLLATLVVVVDWKGYRRWAYPLVVAGMNPITLYCIWHNFGGSIRQRLQIHFGSDLYAVFGEDFVPVTQRLFVLLVLWLIVAWMYRQRIFVRI